MHTLSPELHAQRVLTRAQHTQYDVKPQEMSQSASEDQSHPSQSAMVALCPIPISESMTGPGAGLLSFGTVVEPAILPDD